MESPGLRRDPENRVIAGVCGGIARGFGWRPWSFRILYAVMTLITALLPGVIAYVVLWRLMPERKRNPDAEALGMFVDPDDPMGGYRF